VKNTDHSSYSVFINYPKGCGGGGQGTGTQARIHAGQHVTRFFYVPTDCRGTYTGQVTYIPDLGPEGKTAAFSAAPAQATARSSSDDSHLPRRD
jgi:hypothetical protein